MDSTYEPGVMTKNLKGEWVPSIPEPFRGLFRKQCQCGERFATVRGYRGHYALAHILKMDW
jgi:hypothetical protein